MIADGKKQWKTPLDTEGKESDAGNLEVKEIINKIIDEKYCATCCAKTKRNLEKGQWDKICHK